MIQEHLLDIMNQFDTPLYLLEWSELERNLDEFRKAFHQLGAPFAIAYPLKTNSTELILRFFQQQGCWAEVSSEAELQKAIAIGYLPQNVIYNSPYKRMSSLEKSLGVGCNIHVDNFEELNRIFSIASSLKPPIKVGVRLTNINTKWEKFGFSLKQETDKLLELISQQSQLIINAFHIHQSNISDLSIYRQHLRVLFDFAGRIQNAKNVKLEYIDIGSGFAVNYPAPKKKPDWIAPSIRNYAEIIQEEWGRQDLDPKIRIVIEPGRRLVASSMKLLTKVISIKKRGKKSIAILDLGQNLIPGVDFYRYPIVKIDSEVSAHSAAYELHGSLCDSMDIIASKATLPFLQVGDHLLIENVGGYDISRSFSWQIEIPKIVVVKDNQISISAN